MRTIKFRAWDPKNKYMIDDVHMAHSIYLNKFFRDAHKEEIRLIFMQYTGLKDKNDKEIYEGDIVRVITKRVDGDKRFKNQEEILEVVYYAPSFKCLEEPVNDMWELELEVIGNIYEDKHLLSK